MERTRFCELENLFLWFAARFFHRELTLFFAPSPLICSPFQARARYQMRPFLSFSLHLPLVQRASLSSSSGSSSFCETPFCFFLLLRRRCFEFLFRIFQLRYGQRGSSLLLSIYAPNNKKQ